MLSNALTLQMYKLEQLTENMFILLNVQIRAAKMVPVSFPVQQRLLNIVNWH